MRSRRLGLVLVVAGLVVLAYAAAVVFWRDPASDLYNRYQQNRLDSALEKEFRAWESSAPPETDRSAFVSRLVTTRDARRFRRSLEEGQPFGRLAIPRLDLDDVVVHGTSWGSDLSRGPGHYEQTSVPGLGQTVGIAGHRTMFGAPFRHIDRLQPGDMITLHMPYGTFRYRVFAHKVVDSDDWSVIENRGFDAIMLSACHPLYSASHRWIVFGRLVEVRPRTGEPYTVAAAG
jgi:sortase A